MRSADDKEARWREAYPRMLNPIVARFKLLAVWLLLLWFCYTAWALILSFT